MSKKAFNEKRAKEHARRLQKASSQGAQPPTPSQISNPVSGMQKIRMINKNGDELSKPLRRKAGSGDRVVTSNTKPIEYVMTQTQ